MSQHLSYPIPSHRLPQVFYDNASSRALSRELDPGRLQTVPLDVSGPTRPHQFGYPEAQLGPRATQVSYEGQDSRITPYRDNDHGRPQTTSGDCSASGHGRVHNDSGTDPRTEILARQARTGADAGTRYGHEFEPMGQPGSWAAFPSQSQVHSFDTLAVDQLSSQNGQMVPESVIPGQAYIGSPRSSSGREPRPPSARNSNDALSTATNAVESATDSEIPQMLSKIASTLVQIQQGQAEIIKKIQEMDLTTTTRLNDFREHVDKKFERFQDKIEGCFEELWDRTITEAKSTRALMNGHGDVRRTPPRDDDELGLSSKRRR